MKIEHRLFALPGLLLFSLYANDLPKDDVQLYLSCSYVRKIDENIRKLKEEVNKVHRGKPKEILMSHCTQMRLLTNF